VTTTNSTKSKSPNKQAFRYVKHGCAVLPLYTVKHGACTCAKGKLCAHAGKHPQTPNGVKDATTDRNQIRAWKWSNANIGVATGHGLFVLDVDGKVGRKNLKRLEAKHGPLPVTVTVETGKGRHYYFRCDDDVHVRNRVGHPAKGIDVRGKGGYVVGAGSRHSSGRMYRFAEGRGLDDVEIAAGPKWLMTLVAAKANTKNQPEIPAIPPEKLDRARAYADAALRRELERLGKAPMHQRNHTLNIAAFKLGQLVPYGILNSQTATEELIRAASQIGLDETEIKPTIRSGLGAGERSPRRLPFIKSDLPDAKEPRKSKNDVTAELAAFGETDTDNGQRFATRFRNKVIYTPGNGWFVYDGKRWRPDGLLQVNELAKKTARLIVREVRHLDGDSACASRRKFAQQSLATGALGRMLESAKSLLAVEDKNLDADPWLLNVENGTIDLRTGLRENHDPRDLLSKIAPVRGDRKAKCPNFKKFLKRITGNDARLCVFIQKAVGYTLTGSISEQVFFFVYGRSGNNGKSTLVNLIREMMGDYGLHTHTDTFLVKQYDNNIPADLARLKGARMVTAIEANPNRQLDAAKVKGITGGEPIEARFMRQNFFQYDPEFKLWLVANDPPRVRGTDEALWRRVRVIPLTIDIPKEERDHNLPQTLRSEWPGILAWAVRGCLKWQQNGLNPSRAVREATEAWHSQMDHLKRFVEEELVVSPGNKVGSKVVYDLYKKWCSVHGEHILTMEEFNDKLIDSFNFTHARIKGRSWWRGVQLRTATPF
jgi:putative DNA primase/helicase